MLQAHVIGGEMITGGGVNQAYSRLSTTHGHITDCMITIGNSLKRRSYRRRHQVVWKSEAAQNSRKKQGQTFGKANIIGTLASAAALAFNFSSVQHH